MTTHGLECEVDGCAQPLYQSKRFCGAHRGRFYRYGDPLAQPEPWRQDLTGQRFGSLTASAYDTSQRKWICRCDCGAESSVRAWSLTSGGTRTCNQRRRHTVPGTYPSAHEHVRAWRGRAEDHACSHCDAPAAQWAYRRVNAVHRFESEFGPWSPDPSDYAPMCVPCHKRFDLASGATERAEANGLHPLF